MSEHVKAMCWLFLHVDSQFQLPFAFPIFIVIAPLTCPNSSTRTKCLALWIISNDRNSRLLPFLIGTCCWSSSLIPFSSGKHKWTRLRYCINAFRRICRLSSGRHRLFSSQWTALTSFLYGVIRFVRSVVLAYFPRIWVLKNRFHNSDWTISVEFMFGRLLLASSWWTTKCDVLSKLWQIH